jgi:hypothetical protein
MFLKDDVGQAIVSMHNNQVFVGWLFSKQLFEQIMWILAYSYRVKIFNINDALVKILAG